MYPEICVMGYFVLFPPTPAPKQYRLTCALLLKWFVFHPVVFWRQLTISLLY